MKTLGQVNFEAAGTGLSWLAGWPFAQEVFERMAQAVIQAHEARQWKEWPPPAPIDHVIAYRADSGVFEATKGPASGEDDDGELYWWGDGGYTDLTSPPDMVPTHWRILPAPPEGC